MIYQIHPEHGKHIAYGTVEADANIKNGWKTVTEDEFNGKPKEEKKTNPLSDRELLEIAYIAKFNKKPHHKMKDETIQEKLDE